MLTIGSTISAAFLTGVLICAPLSARAEVIRTGGTGATYETLKRLGEAYAAIEAGAAFEVVPSLGSSGGIMAVTDGVLDFSVSGRPLKPEEKAKGLTELALLRTPFALVTSTSSQSLKSTEAARFYDNEKAVWANGTPVRVILRPKSDSDTAVLGGMLPGMSAAIDKVRARPDVPIAATDQDNVEAAERIPGSLVAATYTQIEMEGRKLSYVAIDGIAPTLENFESGAYPYGKTFHFIFPARTSASLKRFIAFLDSPAGLKVIRETGNLPATR